jgi:agmatine deiminase
MVTAWPSHADLWGADLAPAREAIAAMVHAIAEGERVHALVASADAEASAKAMLGHGADIEIVRLDFGDIWLRDTGPIFLSDGHSLKAATFQWNGWGGKYLFEADRHVARAVAAHFGVPVHPHNFVLEGGAIEGDGTGLVLTTEQCLLNPNRNPHMTRADVEERLRDELGFTRVVWLGDGLAGDHTDGHVDNLARFVAPGVVLIPESDNADANAGAYQAAEVLVKLAGLEVVRAPAVLVPTNAAEPVAASYMNFVIGNAAVVVPTYGAPSDDVAVAKIAEHFPGRRVVGVRADAVLTGGGSFHCITQQVPALG